MDVRQVSARCVLQQEITSCHISLLKTNIIVPANVICVEAPDFYNISDDS